MSKVTFLYQPLKPFKKTQLFGEDKACTDIETNKKFVYKEDAAQCPVGYISLYKKLGMNAHNGIDYAAKLWQPIYASCDGYVEEVQTEVERGLGIGVVTDSKYYCYETNQEDYFKYRNWHFQAINVVIGQKVKTGDLLGWAGMTGYATGVHDHFETKPVRFNSKGKMYNVLQDNGYYGCVDPQPYMLNVCGVDVNAFKKIKETMALILDKFTELLRKS